MLTLFADTDMDLTPATAKKYGYKLISMPYSTDGKTVYPYEDYEVFDAHAFYDMLRGGTIPTTSAVSKERYIRYFEPEFAAGSDILYVHFSAAMSATFGNMNEAVKELTEKYPERKFYEIDTKGISILSLSIALEVSDLIRSGKSPEEVVEWAKEEAGHFAVYFFADDLKFFRKSGRVSGLAATMGTLLGVRPIIYVNEEGKMVSIGKERGKSKAIARLISYMEELGDDLKNHRVFVADTDSPEMVEELTAEIKERFGEELNVEVVTVNPTIGSHCGPNASGVCFHSKHR